jgi:acetyltransferase-like isoleucine patch superfamily enzyme
MNTHPEHGRPQDPALVRSDLVHFRPRSLRSWIQDRMRDARLRRLRVRSGREGIAVLLQALYHSLEPRILLRGLGATVGDGTVVYQRLRLQAPDAASFALLLIGRDSHVGRECFLDLHARIELEELTVLGMRSAILTRDRESGSTAPVRILRGAATGACVTILPGVTVGECAMVGGGSVVTRDVPDHSLVVGSPARVVRRLAPQTVNR